MSGKKVIVFPRREKYKEHLDDHQIGLRDAFVNSGYALKAENKEELVKAIEESKNFKPKVFKSNNERMNQLIIDFIERN